MQNNLPPVHPGEIPREELDELGVSANAFARTLADVATAEGGEAHAAR